ncbi:MAG: hypothetical protein ACJ71G_17025 [Nitrososphaeraceae archaeon]|jgi:hypothetical protein
MVMMNNNSNSMQGKKRYRTEAEEWYFRLMNDPKQFEKERYINAIDVYNSIIEEFQKLYEKTPASDRLTRVKILDGIEQSKRDLAKIHAEYETFKKYKMRTAISK